MPGDFKGAAERFRSLTEALNATRRPLYDRINRKLREKLNPPTRDLFRARRERHQRHRRHRWANVAMPARKIVTSAFRKR